jgi:hypothetical protein
MCAHRPPHHKYASILTSSSFTFRASASRSPLENGTPSRSLVLDALELGLLQHLVFEYQLFLQVLNIAAKLFDLRQQRLALFAQVLNEFACVANALPQRFESGFYGPHVRGLCYWC